MCSKAIYDGDPIWECLDCQSASFCIQCQECFENSNHEGHRVLLHKNLTGSCDCGDAKNWKPEGNCTKHGG